MSKAEAIGIVAGWGEYPLEVARALRDKGHTVVVAAVYQHAAKEIEQIAHHVKWIGVCKLGGMQRFFLKHEVRHVCLSGKLFKDRILFHGWGWLEHLPDWECVKTMFPLFYSRHTTTTDDSLLGAVVQSFLRRGINTIPGTEYAPQLLAEPGILTRTGPSKSQLADIDFGWKIAKQMGGLDVGQSVTVRDRTILAVEAIEGTDACIVRTGQVCPRGGFSLVKVAKPQQDMRFDVPTIGPQTIERMRKVGGKAIGIEAGKTILIDRAKTIKLADDFGIAILSR
jgi:UDP-2,3-diacylglucosamine hydrolase